MNNSKLLSQLGVFIRPNFLSPEQCHAICTEMREAATYPAGLTYESVDRIDEQARRTKVAEVGAATKSLLKAQLAALKPELEQHFSQPLAGCESPQFLGYHQHDFFQAHIDNDSSPKSHSYMQQRRVSVVIFLNNAGNELTKADYCGGALVLYGLIQKPQWESYGFPLSGEAGLLVAFRSDIFHEVTPVTAGERFTVVSWFFSATDRQQNTNKVLEVSNV